MIISIILFLTGSFALFLGAEGLVRGSIKTADHLGINPLIIGATVVAFGTSAPELIVTLISTLAGSSDIALGNIIGSNIANIGLILAIAAFINPVAIDKTSRTFYYPVMLVSSLVFYGFAFSGHIVMSHGIVFLFGIVVYTLYILRSSGHLPNTEHYGGKRTSLSIKYLVLIPAGIGLLLAGSHLMIDSGIKIARALGVSEFVIGASMVAVGTSLPELATTIVAVYRKNPGILLGNILGSNIFNILFVAGGVSVIRPIAVNTSALAYEFPAMIAFTAVLYLLLRTGASVSRGEGCVLLAGYGLFIWFLF